MLLLGDAAFTSSFFAASCRLGSMPEAVSKSVCGEEGDLCHKESGSCVGCGNDMGNVPSKSPASSRHL